MDAVAVLTPPVGMDQQRWVGRRRAGIIMRPPWAEGEHVASGLAAWIKDVRVRFQAGLVADDLVLLSVLYHN